MPDPGVPVAQDPTPLGATDEQLFSLLTALDADYAADQGAGGPGPDRHPAVLPSRVPHALRRYGVQLHPQDAARLQALSARTWAARAPSAGELPETERYDQRHRALAAQAAAREVPDERPGALRTFGAHASAGLLRGLLSTTAGIAGLARTVDPYGFSVGAPAAKYGEAAQAAIGELDRKVGVLDAAAGRPVTAMAGGLTGGLASLAVSAPLKLAGVAGQVGLSTGGDVIIEAKRQGASQADADLAGVAAMPIAGALTYALPGTAGSFVGAFGRAPAVAPGAVKAMLHAGTQQALQSPMVGGTRDLAVAAAAGQEPDWGEFGKARLLEAAIGGPLGVAGEGIVQGLHALSRSRPTIASQDLNQLAVLEAIERARAAPPAEVPLAQETRPAVAPDAPASEAELLDLFQALRTDPRAEAQARALAEPQQQAAMPELLARQADFEEGQQVRQLQAARQDPAALMGRGPDREDLAQMQAWEQAMRAPRPEQALKALAPRQEALAVSEAPTPPAAPDAPAAPPVVEPKRLRDTVTLEGEAFPVEPGKTPAETAAAARALQEAPTDRFVKPQAAEPKPATPPPAVEAPPAPRSLEAPKLAEEPTPVLRNVKHATFVGDAGGNLGVFKLPNGRYVGAATSRKAVTDARLSGRIPYAQRGPTFETEAAARAAVAAAPASKMPPVRQTAEVRRGPAPKELAGGAVDDALAADPRLADLKAKLDEPGADLEAVRAEARARLPKEEVTALAKSEQPALEAGEVTAAPRVEVEAAEIQEPAPKALARVKALADAVRSGKRPAPEKATADLFDAAEELASSTDAAERAHALAIRHFILPRIREKGLKALPEMLDELEAGLRDARPMMLPPADSPVAATSPDGLSVQERELVVRSFARDLGLPEPHLVKGLTHEGRRVNGAVIGDMVMVDDSGHLAPMIGALAHEKIHTVIRGLDEGGLADLKARLADLRDVPGIGELETRLGQEGLPAGKYGLAEEAISDAAVHVVLTNKGNILAELAPRTQKVLVTAFRALGRAIKKMLRSLVGLKDVTPRAKASLENLADWLLRYKPDSPEQVARRKAQAEALRADMVEAYNAFKTGDLGEQLQNAIVKTLGRGAKVLGSKSEGSGVAQAANDLYTKTLVRDIDMGRKYAEFGHVRAASDVADAEAASAIEPLLRAATGLEQLPRARRKVVDKAVFDNHVRQIRRGQDGMEPETEAEQHTWMRSQGVTAYEEGVIREIYSSLDAANVAHQDAIFRFAGMEPEPLPQLEAKIKAESDPVTKANMQAVYDSVKSSQDAATYGYVPLVRASKGAFLVVHNPADPAKNLRLPVSRLDALNEAKMAALAKEKGGASATEYTVEHDPVFTDERFDSMDTLEKQLRTALGKAGLPESEGAISVQETLRALTPALVRGRLSAHQLRSRAVSGYETNLVDALKSYSHTARGGLRAMLFHGEARPWLDQIASGGRPNVQSYTNQWVKDLYQNSNTPQAKLTKLVRMGVSARLLSNAGQMVNSAYSNFIANPWTGMSVVGYGQMGRSLLLGLTEQAKVHPLILAQLADSNLATMAKVLRRTANLSESAKLSAWAEWLDSKAAGAEMANLRATIAEHAGAKDLAAAIRRTAEETNLFADIGAKDINSRPLGPAVQGGLEHMVAAMIWLNTQTDRAGRLGTFATFYKVAKEFTTSNWERQQYRYNYVGEHTPEAWARWATEYLAGGTGRMSRPPAFRGNLGSLLYQLAGYGLAQARNVAWMLKDPFTGPVGPGGRKQELLRLAAPLGLAATWVGIAGIRNGIPLLNPLAGAIESWFMDQPLDQMMNEKAAEGSTLGQMWSKGATQYIPGAAGEVLSETGRAAGPRGLIVDRVQNAINIPAVSAGKMVYEGGGAVIDGIEQGDTDTVLDGLTQMTGGVPKAIREVGKSYTRGLTTTSPDARTPYAARAAKARTVVPAKDVTAGERTMLALGGTPERVQRIRTTERALSEVRAENEVERAIFVRDLTAALVSQDRSKITAAGERYATMIRDAAAEVKATFEAKEADPTQASKARWLEAVAKRGQLDGLLSQAREAFRQSKGGIGAFNAGRGRVQTMYLRTEVPVAP